MLLKIKNYIWTSLHVIFIFAVVTFSISNLFYKRLAVSDFSPFYGSFLASIKAFYFVWDGNFSGGYFPSNYLQVFRSFFEIFNNQYIAQASFFIFILIFSYFGFYKILERYKCDLAIRVIAPLFYLFNPAISTELLNGYTGALVIYSFTPWLYLLLEEVYEKYSLRKGIALSFLVGFFLLNIQIALWVYIPLGIYLALTVIFDSNRDYKKVFRILLHGLLGVLLNLISVLTLFNYAANFSNSSYLNTFRYTYAKASFINLFVMLGNNGSRQVDLGYYDSRFITISALVVFIAAVGVYVFSFKQKISLRERKLAVFSMVTLLMLMGLFYGIKNGYLDTLIDKKNAIVVSLRSPIKLFYSFGLVYILLLSTSLHRLMKNNPFILKKSTFYRFTILLSVLCVFIGLNRHFLNGDLGFQKIMKNDSYYITSKYDDLKSLLSKNEDSYFLYLPFDYPIQIKLNGVKNLVKERMGGKISSSQEGGLLKNLFDDICVGNTESILQNKLNIDFVVIDKHPSTYHTHTDDSCSPLAFYGTPYIWGSYSYFDKLFNASEVYYEDQNFKIYRLGVKKSPSVSGFARNTYLDLSEGTLSTDIKNELGIQHYVQSAITKRASNKVTSLFGDERSQVSGGINTIKELFKDQTLVEVVSSTSSLGPRYFMYSKKINEISFTKNAYVQYKERYVNKISLNELSISNIPDLVSIRRLIPTSLNSTLFALTNSGALDLLTRDDRIITTNKSSSTVTVSGSVNIINNPSFESGSWQQKVGDCNKTDNNPILAMTLDRASKTDGRQSLRLEATRHTACVSTNIPIAEPGDYAFTFDYQSPNAQKAGFYLQFNDANKTVVRETIGIENANWNTYTRKITIPAGATSTKLYFYSYSIDEKTNVITRYDNVHFGKLKPVTTVTLPKAEGFEKIPVALKAGENTFEYKDPRYTYKNLFTNPSFETAMWQPNVGDCNRYDDKPQIAMVTTTQEKTDGLQALELSSTRHTACTLTTIPVKGGSTYLASFDYQSPNAKTASYYIGFNDPEKSSLKGDLQITGQAWQMFSDTITVPKGATSLSFYVYAKETDKKTNIINRYDNFKLIEVPDLRDAFYLVSEPTSTLVEPTSITFDLINPTKKQVHIKGATTPFFLGMSESYHDQWQLQVRNEKIEGWLRRWSPFAKPDRVGDAYHYKLNGFLNAWYVDTEDLCVKQEKCTKNPDGSYDIEMTIEFWPQRWFYLGLLISGTTLVGCLGYLAFDGVRILRRKRKAKQTTV